MTMDMAARADAYNLAFAHYPASHLRVVAEQGKPVVYGTWVLGNDYRTRSPFYGSYPRGYLARVMALFPDARREGISDVLHVFAGSLPQSDEYVTLDLKKDEIRDPDFLGSVYDVGAIFGHRDGGAARTFSLVIADPPYSEADAEKYGTPMVDRRRALRALAQVVEPGGHVVWLDTVWPMHRKVEWRTAGRIAVREEKFRVAGDITVWRSTNHRLRAITIFERAA